MCHVTCDTWFRTCDTWHMTCDTLKYVQMISFFNPIGVSDMWQVTNETLHMTHDTWYMTCDMGHMTHDMWRMTHDTWHWQPSLICSNYVWFLVLVLLSSHVEVFSVSCMLDFQSIGPLGWCFLLVDLSVCLSVCVCQCVHFWGTV